MPTLELSDAATKPSLVPQPPSWKHQLRYGVTIFCGAFLLFQVQLVLGKYILPWFGGTPAVWTTCMLFFQLLLLGGYFYSHLVSKLDGRRQALVQLSLLVLSVIVLAAGVLLWKTPLLPGLSWRPASQGSPVVQILSLLTVGVGLPYLCLSTNGPLLQSWFARTQEGAQPYRLYALSNLGSLLGLVTYPFIFEPQFHLRTQAWMWSAAYMIFVVGFFFCAKDIRGTASLTKVGVELAGANSPSRSVQLLWFLLPAFASLMLLATTNLLCQEVAVVPFLWVLPLGIYLLSFILCFDSPKWYRRGIWQLLMGAGLPMAVVVMLSQIEASMGRQVAMLSLVLLGCCMVCHGELARLKPEPDFLTRFYLLVSAGGAAGGIFVAVVAPHIFAGFWEFHFGLVGCVVVVMFTLAQDRNSWWYWAKPYLGSVIVLGLLLALEFVAQFTGLVGVSEIMFDFRYYPILMVLSLVSLALVVGTRKKKPSFRRFNSAQLAALLVVAALCAGLAAQVQLDKHRAIRRDRNFYGSLTVKNGRELNSKMLRHGQTPHGAQSYYHPKEPTAYYSRRSGIGLLLQEESACQRPCPRRYGVIGLGVGTLAAYGRESDTIRFYEINPQVIAYSQGPSPYFTFIRDSAAKIEIVPGDGRLSLQREADQGILENFDVLVVDAFNSDAIPVHLLTQEAMEVYLKHLRGPTSVLAFHVSNRVLDLRPVLLGLAAHNHLAIVRLCKELGTDWGQASDWVLLARDPSALASDGFRDWHAPMPTADEGILWTDDYTNLFRILRRLSFGP